LAKEIGCKFIETSSGLNHKVDELLVGIVAQVKLNPQRIRNLSEKQRLAMQRKFEEPQDHFSELRRNERNKSNVQKNLSEKGKASPSTVSTTTSTTMGKKGNKENNANNDDVEADESDDERSSDEGDTSDIEKYLNLDEKSTQQMQQQQTQFVKHGESSSSANYTRLLKTRRYATPGMGAVGAHYGLINSFFNNDDRELSNSNNNVSTSSCSTPTTSYPTHYNNQTKQTNKRDFTSSYESSCRNPSSSQPATPKKSNLSGAESDTGAEKCINKFSNRTKMFLTSFLKFKRSLRVKRRNSNSCSDLFVI
jgi:hypothetical protein